MADDWGIASSFLPLRRVLMHRPRRGLERITPASLGYWNFTRAVMPERFLAEYDELIATLVAEGVEPVLLGDVLGSDDEALAYLDQHPNATYTRDSAFLLARGAVLMSMALPSRAGEPPVVARALARLGVPILGRIEPPALLEGGGVQLVGDRSLLVALCDRANQAAVEQLRRLLLGPHLDEIVSVAMPPGTIHIDGDLVVIDRDLAVGYVAALGYRPATVYRAGAEPLQVPLLNWLAERCVELIELDRAERDAMGANLVAIAPRAVVGYAAADAVGARVADRDGRFLGVADTELIQGNGGPHCMTLELLRSAT